MGVTSLHKVINLRLSRGSKMKKIGINSFVLHIIAMALMLCDHLWATIVPGSWWMTNMGRLAFPIFSFMLVEGFFHTRDRKRYALRLLVFALISELPFNLMYGSSVFYPYHQNVLWTFLLAFGCMTGIEAVKKRGVFWQTAAASVFITLFGSLAGLLLMVDYFHFGVLTVMVFYFFRGRKWYHYAGQLAGLIYINVILFAGLEYTVTLFGFTFAFPQQGLAVLSLLPIWLCNGQQGPHNKWIQYCFYAFYPVHMLILSLIVKLM